MESGDVWGILFEVSLEQHCWSLGGGAVDNAGWADMENNCWTYCQYTASVTGSHWRQSQLPNWGCAWLMEWLGYNFFGHVSINESLHVMHTRFARMTLCCCSLWLATTDKVDPSLDDGAHCENTGQFNAMLCSSWASSGIQNWEILTKPVIRIKFN